MSSNLLEICCYSVQSAIIAEQNGADRIELCAGVYEGGITPSHACISMVKSCVSIPVHVIIRPRGADFCYSDIEFECMKQDIQTCKELGVEGIVSGILLPNGCIDTVRTKELIELSHPMSFTFHRAFDMSRNRVEALEMLIDIGADRILTSGGMQTAEQGLENIRELVRLADSRIKIMPGSGINSKNIAKIRDVSQAKEFHCSAKKLIRGEMQYQNPNINMGGDGSIPEFEYYEADGNLIKEIRECLNASQ